jgi:hypothetical protein
MAFTSARPSTRCPVVPPPTHPHTHNIHTHTHAHPQHNTPHYTAAQLQGYLSAPRSLSSLHFGTWLLSEQPPAKSRVVSEVRGLRAARAKQRVVAVAGRAV